MEKLKRASTSFSLLQEQTENTQFSSSDYQNDGWEPFLPQQNSAGALHQSILSSFIQRKEKLDSIRGQEFLHANLSDFRRVLAKRTQRVLATEGISADKSNLGENIEGYVIFDEKENNYKYLKEEPDEDQIKSFLKSEGKRLFGHERAHGETWRWKDKARRGGDDDSEESERLEEEDYQLALHVLARLHQSPQIVVCIISLTGSGSEFFVTKNKTRCAEAHAILKKALAHILKLEGAEIAVNPARRSPPSKDSLAESCDIEIRVTTQDKDFSDVVCKNLVEHMSQDSLGSLLTRQGISVQSKMQTRPAVFVYGKGYDDVQKLFGEPASDLYVRITRWKYSLARKGVHVDLHFEQVLDGDKEENEMVKEKETVEHSCAQTPSTQPPEEDSRARRSADNDRSSFYWNVEELPHYPPESSSRPATSFPPSPQRDRHMAALPKRVSRHGTAADIPQRRAIPAVKHATREVKSSLGLETEDVESISNYFNEIKQKKLAPQRGFCRPPPRPTSSFSKAPTPAPSGPRSAPASRHAAAVQDADVKTNAMMQGEEVAEDNQMYWSTPDLKRESSAHSRPRTSVSSRSARDELEAAAAGRSPYGEELLEQYVTAERKVSSAGRALEALEVQQSEEEPSLAINHHDKHEMLAVVDETQEDTMSYHSPRSHGSDRSIMLEASTAIQNKFSRPPTAIKATDMSTTVVKATDMSPANRADDISTKSRADDMPPTAVRDTDTSTSNRPNDMSTTSTTIRADDMSSTIRANDISTAVRQHTKSHQDLDRTSIAVTEPELFEEFEKVSEWDTENVKNVRHRSKSSHWWSKFQSLQESDCILCRNTKTVNVSEIPPPLISLMNDSSVRSSAAIRCPLCFGIEAAYRKEPFSFGPSVGQEKKEEGLRVGLEVRDKNERVAKESRELKLKLTSGSSQLVDVLIDHPGVEAFAVFAETRIWQIDLDNLKVLARHDLSRAFQTFAACASSDGILFLGSLGRIFEVNTHGESLIQAKLKGQRGKILCLSVSPDRLVLVSGSSQGSTFIWSTQTRQVLHCLITSPALGLDAGEEQQRSFDFAFHHHRDEVTSCLSLNGTAITGSKDGSLCVFHLPLYRKRWQVEMELSSLQKLSSEEIRDAMGPDKVQTLMARAEKLQEELKALTTKCRRTLLESATYGSVLSILHCEGSSGRPLVFTAHLNAVCCWDLKTGSASRLLSVTDANFVCSMCVASSFVMAGLANGKLLHWPIEEEVCGRLTTWSMGDSMVRMRTSRSSLLAVSSDHLLRVWSMRQWRRNFQQKSSPNLLLRSRARPANVEIELDEEESESNGWSLRTPESVGTGRETNKWGAMAQAGQELDKIIFRAEDFLKSMEMLKEKARMLE